MRVLSALTLAALACGIALAADPVAVPFGKLKATVPADWKAERPSNRLRSHQFRLPSGDPALADAEVYVMPESPPDPAKVFPRWKATVVPPDGKTPDDATKESKFDAGGATVHLLDATGTWKYRERPFDPRSKEEQRPEYRVVWAVVQHGDEATHVRLSGPQAVVAKHYPAFEQWLKGMK